MKVYILESLALVALAAMAMAEISYREDTICPEPELRNGQVIVTQSTDSMFVGKFKCDHGYTLVGSSKIKCRGGEWTSKLPVCTVIGGCDELPDIANGHKIAIRGFRGSVYRFKCNYGFRRYGAKNIHCTGSSWNTGLPVCTKATCDETEMVDIPFGQSHALMNGAVYKYRCDEEAKMFGNNMVYCNGNNWNGTIPTCLAAPKPPAMETTVNGEVREKFKLGESVTVTCQSQGGNPVPEITIIKDGNIVAEANHFRNTFTFVAAAEHHDKEIQCLAENSVAGEQARVNLDVSFAPSSVIVDGPSKVRHHGQYSYQCRTQPANPKPEIIWSVKDHRGESRQIESGDEDSQDTGAGWETVSTIELQTSDIERGMAVTCLAGNSAGRVSHTLHVHTQYVPESVMIEGPSSMAHDDEDEFVCYTSSSYPAASIMWRMEKSNGLTEDDLMEGETTTEMTEDGGYTARSVLRMKDVGQEVDRVTLQCVAIVPGMDKDVHSELLNVDVTANPGEPLIAGLRSGSAVTLGSHHSLTCSAKAGNPPASIIWLRNGEKEGAEQQHHGRNVISHWEYVAQIGDDKITCQVTNGVSEKSVASVHVKVVQPVQPVKLESERSGTGFLLEMLQPFEDEDENSEEAHQNKHEDTVTEERFEEEETHHANHEVKYEFENEIEEGYEVPTNAEEEPVVEVVNQKVAQKVSAAELFSGKSVDGSSASSVNASCFTILVSLLCFYFIKL